MQPLQSAATGAALNSKENTSLPQSGKLGSRVVTYPIASPDTQKIEELLAESIDTPNGEGGDRLCMLAGSFSPFDELYVKQVFHDSSCVVDPVESKVEKSFDALFHVVGSEPELSNNTLENGTPRAIQIIKDEVSRLHDAISKVQQGTDEDVLSSVSEIAHPLVVEGLNRLNKLVESGNAQFPVHPVFFFMHALQTAVQPYVGLFDDNPITEAFRAELDSHPLLTSLFSENWELFEAVSNTPMLLNVIVQKGELLSETAAKEGIAKLSRKELQGLPFSLLAIRAEDGAGVVLKVTQSVLGSGAYKVAKGMHDISAGRTPSEETAKASLRKQHYALPKDRISGLEEDFEKEAVVSKLLREAGAKNVLPARFIRYKNKAHLFSKKCQAGSLESYGQKYASSDPKERKREALRLAYEQGVTLHIMHTQCGLCHLDYKAGNIMLDGDPKNISSLSTRLSDFGTASPILDEIAVECTATYPPPEMKYGGPAIPVNPAIDMWSFGVMLNQLYHPNQSVRDLAFDQQGTIKQHNLLREIRERGSLSNDPVDALIAKLLSNDPKSRPTAAEVTQELQNISELIA